VKPFIFIVNKIARHDKRSNCKTNYVFPINVEYCKCSISDKFRFLPF